MQTLAGILGTYHQTAPITTFTAERYGSSHPTDLAGLRGARLVTAIETEEGRAWAEAKICSLTGGDRVSVRFKRQDFFSFTPTFKLMIAGNHQPRLRAVNEAIRRRFQMVPFAVTIPPEKRDKDLADRLKSEWGAILLWMIEGCAEWQRTTSNWYVAILSNTGIIGGTLLALFIARLFLRRGPREPGVAEFVAGLKFSLLPGFVMAALAGTTPDLGVGMGATFGLITSLASGPQLPSSPSGSAMPADRIIADSRAADSR